METKDPKAKTAETEVRFGDGISSGIVAAAGALSGLGIAVGIPVVILPSAAVIGQGMVTGIIITALVLGATVCLVSAFFGLVMPRRVGGPLGDPESWAALTDKWRGWEREHHGRRRRGGRPNDEDMD
jgi:hypothetical protein